MNQNGEDARAQVGYGNPPAHSRFKPGQSGNPRGRRRAALNVATVLERTLRERVLISENGTKKFTSKLEATIKKLTDKALAGDLKAMQLVMSVRTAEERSKQSSSGHVEFHKVEDKKESIDKLLAKLAL